MPLTPNRVPCGKTTGQDGPMVLPRGTTKRRAAEARRAKRESLLSCLVSLTRKPQLTGESPDAGLP